MPLSEHFFRESQAFQEVQDVWALQVQPKARDVQGFRDGCDGQFWLDARDTRQASGGMIYFLSGDVMKPSKYARQYEDHGAISLELQNGM